MNRNRDIAIDILFDIVKFRFDLTDRISLPKDFYSPRWVKGNADDANWLTKLEIKAKIEVTNERYFTLIKYEGCDYFITTGYEEPDSFPNGLVGLPMNSGLFTAIISELELPIKQGITNNYIEDKILSQNKSDALYEGHQFEDLIPIFPSVFAMEVTHDYFGDPNNLDQLICCYLSLNKKLITLHFSIETLAKINELILVNSQILNYESIVQALLSSNYKFSFLDFYRCIEMLYQIIYIDEAHSLLSITSNKTDLLFCIDETLKWKPTERNALNKIFSETDAYYFNPLKKAINKIDGGIKSYSDWLYDLRCNIVHLKSAQKKFKLSLDEWEELIFGVVCVTIFWYQKYKVFI